MDPTESLALLLRVGARVLRVIDDGGQPCQYDAGILAEGIKGLSEWISRGGDLPAQWKPCFDCGAEVSKDGRCIRHGKLVAPVRPALVPGA